MTLKQPQEASDLWMYQTCLQKKGYAAIPEAFRVADLCTKDRGTPIYVYKCPSCSSHHLTRRKGPHVIKRLPGSNQAIQHLP
jgi:hypothetical protein